MTACGGGTIGYMYVLGTFYNQISGFKIDDYTGNLTAINHSPFTSGGSNPQSVVIKPGGRYIYVINSGTGQIGLPGMPTCVAPNVTNCFTGPVGAGISEFAVGGDGILTFQQTYFTQGTAPTWAAIDTSGNFLYVVDKYSKYYCSPAQGTQANCATGTLGDVNGSITAFSIAPDTGRLTLVVNTSVLVAGTQVPTTVFEVGPNPVMAEGGLGGCLFTLSPNSIYPYQVSTSTGQLTVASTGPYTVGGSSNLTSINTSMGTAANFIYLTDGGNNQIFSLQSGGGSGTGTTCSLTPISGSQQTNLSGTGNPVNSVTSSSGKFLYVINQQNPLVPTAPSVSSISAFTINGLGQLQTLADSTNNPYTVGSGPVCISQDPTHQYLFVSNKTDSTITGKLIDQNRGYLSDLQHGSTFPVTQTPTCLAISGNTQ